MKIKFEHKVKVLSHDNFKIAFVGAGKVGTALGVYLKKNGFFVNGYFSKTFEHAKKSAISVKSKAYDDIFSLIAESDLIFFTVNDDALSKIGLEISEKLKQNRGRKAFSDKIIVHTSGIYSADILKPLADIGFNSCCAHPLLAINRTAEAVRNLKQAFFFLDGDDYAKNKMIKILKKTGNNFFEINPENKILYHAAACVSSNYLVTLLDFGYKLFEKSGVKTDEIKRVWKPLILSTFNNIAKSNLPKDALTGPIKRHDAETVLKHIAAIKERLPEYLDFYKYMGTRTLRMNEDNSLNNIFEK